MASQKLGPDYLLVLEAGALIMLNSCCTAKDTIKKKKSHGWEKISANEVTYRAFISKIYKQIIQLNNNKTIQSKWAECFPSGSVVKKKKKKKPPANAGDAGPIPGLGRTHTP